MSGIEILIPGMLTSIQDRGRFGFQDTGVSPSGAMDADSLELANILTGNDRGEACLECTVTGPEIRFTGPAVFALTGAPSDPLLNGKPVPMYESVQASSGDLLNVGTVTRGVRTYISIAGGFDLPVVMGSRSTNVRGGFGGFSGRTLKRGDLIQLRCTSLATGFTRRVLPENLKPNFPETITLRALPSHESDRFQSESVKEFFICEWKVSALSDRMGIRLEGPDLRHAGSADIISSGVQTGTVQVPGQGSPIVLAADRQTTGGYPTIAQVCTADLPILGRLAGGARVVFRLVSLTEAQQAVADREESFRALEESFSGPRGSALPEGDSCFAGERHFRIVVNGEPFIVSVAELV